MEGEFPKQFKCPVCFEIPEKEIYQCENGHTICDSCVISLSTCPQCRVNLRAKKIRNRALEDLLDMMKFNCSFVSEGCNTKMTRREISSHCDNCSFGGEQVPLCMYLGYTCKYKVKSRRLQESLLHLKQEHCIFTGNKTFVEVILTNVKKIDCKIKGLWKPLLLNVNSNHYLLVIYSNTGNISLSCIWIGGDSSLDVDANFRITSAISKVPTLEWMTKPIPLAQCETTLKYPPLLVSLESILHTYVDADVLKIEVIMLDIKSSSHNSDKEVIKLDSYMVLPSTQVGQHDDDENSSYTNVMKDMTVKLLSHFSQQAGMGVCCNACRIGPIKGPRYTCLQCCDYYLSSWCMAKNEHAFHHFTFLCTHFQVAAMFIVTNRSNPRPPFLECDNESNPGILIYCEICTKKWRKIGPRFLNNILLIKAGGYVTGSICTDANKLRCEKCENQPDYICLQCSGPCGLCRICFLGEFQQHNKMHFFVITMTDSARQFALHLLSKHGVFLCVNLELPE